MHTSRTWALAALAATSWALFATWLTLGWGGPGIVQIVSNTASPVFGLIAATYAGFAARAGRGRQRHAWFAMAVGLVCWVVGDAIWAYYELFSGLPVAPFPSLGDAGYLLFPVAACVALTILPVGYVGQSQVRALFDGVIVAGSLFLLAWTNGLDELFDASSESKLTFAVSVAYPLTDLVMLSIAILVLARTQVGQRVKFIFLTAGLTAIAVSDSIFMYLVTDNGYAGGHPIDIGYVAGLLLLTAAARGAWQTPAHDQRPGQAPSRMALWLPYVPLPLAMFAGMAEVANGQSTLPVCVTMVVLFATVLVRQFLVLAENRRLLVSVADRALRDPLTGLANRDLFLDRLMHAVTLHLRDGREVTVLSLDLDDFKRVNDSLGHAAGDALLQSVAARILGCVRAGDTVARLGGDEFAVLLEDATSESPVRVAGRIREAFMAPFHIDGQTWEIRPSIGVAMAPSLSGTSGTSAETLLRNADLAMYSAKRGQTGIREFTPDMRLIKPGEVNPVRLRTSADSRRTAARDDLFAQLRRGIDRGDLLLVYQPKFLVATGQLVGVEALVRWSHPQRGILLPASFLPVACENGLMGAVTETVLTRAAENVAQWRTQGLEIAIAVNVFPASLSDLDLASQILRIVKDHGLRADGLTVEITEEVGLGSMVRARDVLDQLRENGVRIALDDFGSGYSALSYLGELQIDELKLDRQFIGPILHNGSAQVIVRSVINMAHTLGLTCVAEGVEDAGTAQLLSQFDCDVIQGNFCGPPIPASDVPLLTAITLAGAKNPANRARN